jgi:hypothetical protein
MPEPVSVPVDEEEASPESAPSPLVELPLAQAAENTRGIYSGATQRSITGPLYPGFGEGESGGLGRRSLPLLE